MCTSGSIVNVSRFDAQKRFGTESPQRKIREGFERWRQKLHPKAAARDFQRR